MASALFPFRTPLTEATACLAAERGRGQEDRVRSRVPSPPAPYPLVIMSYLTPQASGGKDLMLLKELYPVSGLSHGVLPPKGVVCEDGVKFTIIPYPFPSRKKEL